MMGLEATRARIEGRDGFHLCHMNVTLVTARVTVSKGVMMAVFGHFKTFASVWHVGQH